MEKVTAEGQRSEDRLDNYSSSAVLIKHSIRGSLPDSGEAPVQVIPFNPDPPLPLEGRGPGGQGGSSYWDPAVFRPDKTVVSCYSGEIKFSGDKLVKNLPKRPGLKQKKEGCGSWVRKLKSGDEYKDIFHNCGDLGCEVCGPGEMTDKARLVAERFDQYEQAKCAENAVLIPGEARHVVPRQFIFTIAPSHQAELVFRTLRHCGSWNDGYYHDLVHAEYRKALGISGLIGGASFYHDCRVKHPDTGNTGSKGKHLIKREAMLAGNMTDEDPSWKLYDHIRKQDNWQDYYYLATHYHTIAFGKIIDIKEFEEAMPGWTYHMKGPVKNPGGLARYLISHMPMIEGVKSVTWFGRLAPRSLGKTELRTREQVQVHPVTKIPWVIFDSITPEEIGSTWTIKITDYRSFFRTDHKYDLCWYGNVKYQDDPKPGKLRMLSKVEDPDDIAPESSVIKEQWRRKYEARRLAEGEA